MLAGHDPGSCVTMGEKDDPPVPGADAPEPAGLTREQRSAMPPFATVRAFEAIGTTGGIRRAALALSVDHAAVSRHLRALERWTGTALVDRSQGSGGQLTPQGRIYHRRIAAALSELADATQDLRYRSDDTRLRLWCMPGLASEWLTGRIGSFSAAHREIEIELQPSDVPPNFDRHQADAYLHYVIDHAEAPADPKLRAGRVARPAVLAVASPDFVAASGEFRDPADLLGSTLLHETNADQWRRWFGQLGVDAGPDIKGPKFWQGHLTLAAARRGQGVALANALLVHDDLREGRLVALGDWPAVYLGTYMFTTRGDGWRSRTVASFRRWLETSVAESLGGAGSAPVAR